LNLALRAFAGRVDEGNRMDSYLGFIEFFVVALFALAWGVLELVGRRLDRRKEAKRAKESKPT
jgi:hypothetical protein